MRGILLVLAMMIGFCSSPYIGYAAKVVIDPGHGGADPGAIGVNGLYEKTSNSEIAYDLRDILQSKGYEVVMTRSKDTTLTLQQRVQTAKSSGADLFVSIHANSHPSSSIRGTMVLYYDNAHPNPQYPASSEMKKLTPQSRKLAQLVLNAVLEAVPNTNRGLVPSSAYVVRMGNIPSILVETAFLSNGQDVQLLSTSEGRYKYAQGIANGILAYLPPIFKDIGGHWAKDSILRLNELGIAQGDNGKFYPNRELTRAELVAFVDKAFGLEKQVVPASVDTVADPEIGIEAQHDPSVTEQVYGEPSNSEEQPGSGGTGQPAPAAPVFSDLSASHWSYGSMTAAIESGIIRGYPDGTVRPNQPVTRAEVAAVLSRLAEVKTGAGEVETASVLKFSDVSADYWAYDAIMKLADEGIIRGVEEGVYAPQRLVTRAEMATMLDRRLGPVTAPGKPETGVEP
ncbi:N-acetylmuramoyl-L-alanine amidase [Paenibacillus thermotolerans]|uniref:N-acetylmuramoyl-L-alanine amidase n=1 Tax=Paenibacillus thermotolerans TaxID=3027807 RepID=UPI0023685A10|nr:MULTISPECIES: N-acetylmuramoyl-L-alanine amidase [unclassified Paenibacillus]